MLEINKITSDFISEKYNISYGKPKFSWILNSDQDDTTQKSYHIRLYKQNKLVWDSGQVFSTQTLDIQCETKLDPHCEYSVEIEINDNHEQIAKNQATFYSGKLDEPWTGSWIGSKRINNSKNELPPEIFKKLLDISSTPKKAVLYTSALGIYEVELNGRKVGDQFFAPGYTHYDSYLQFQTYDLTSEIIVGENNLRITVANGWYLGQIGIKNNNYDDYRGVLAELHIWDSEGKHFIVNSDESWESTIDGTIRYADFYNGQIIDGNCGEESKWTWEKTKFLLDIDKELYPHFGAYVKEEMRLFPKQKNKLDSSIIYDFGQNHVGVTYLKVNASKGTLITIRHSEIVNRDGSLFTENLRSAKQTLTFICGKDGYQEFLPRFTFMGHRYVEVTASEPIEILGLESLVLTADAEISGSFSCSDPLLSRFQENIEWGQRSNFIEIPTDCPQRDERMGWTGDIAIFAKTAAFNRNILPFMRKWLTDMRLEQRTNGTIPVTIPEYKPYQPTSEDIPIAIWGDAATMVPWAVYMSRGDKSSLALQYESMKKYTESEIRAAAQSGSGSEKYLWNKNPYQYGDWCAPGETYEQWIQKGDYLATAFFANSVDIMRKSAKELGKLDDEARYTQIHQNICNAFLEHCVLNDGKLKGHFQSNYVCALYFGLIPEKLKASVAKHLVELVRINKHLIQTGFAGTPYITFVLADNGYVEDAYKLLQNTECPGWLYTVIAGGTTVWERWDALDKDGHIQMMEGESITDMVSFNHYAYGAVGDYFYRRILGLEPLKAGYRSFIVQPIPGGTLTNAQGSLETPYGKIAVSWKIEENSFDLDVKVPANTQCKVIMPSGKIYEIGSGNYHFIDRETSV